MPCHISKRREESSKYEARAGKIKSRVMGSYGCTIYKNQTLMQNYKLSLRDRKRKINH